jgi:hypothetical protein
MRIWLLEIDYPKACLFDVKNFEIPKNISFTYDLTKQKFGENYSLRLLRIHTRIKEGRGCQASKSSRRLVEALLNIMNFLVKILLLMRCPFCLLSTRNLPPTKFGISIENHFDLFA